MVFPVIDVVNSLTEIQSPQAYWIKLKQSLEEEGSEAVTNCHTLKMVVEYGKVCLTDVAKTKEIFCLIQSILYSNAKPFKL